MKVFSIPNDPASLEEIGRLSSLCFNYDHFASALARVHAFHAISKEMRNASLMLFYGPTGVGKTTIIEQFCRHAAKECSENGQELDTIYLQVPANCTPKALATELLVSFGDPAADKGTMPNMTRRVINYINKLGVSLVVLDEFQHLIETKGEKVLYATADWLKSVTNEVSSSFLLCGLPTVERVIDANPQLKRRVVSKIVLEPLEIDTPSGLKRVQTLLSLFSKELSFENAPVVASEPFVRAIHGASGGTLGIMVNILKLTCLNAHGDGAHAIREEHFKDAVDELTAGGDTRSRSSALVPFRVI